MLREKKNLFGSAVDKLTGNFWLRQFGISAYFSAREDCLSDQDVTDFVVGLKPIVLHSMWSKFGFADSGSTLQALATLRPELILPPLVERLYASLDTVTEPHKLTASMYSVVSVARSLVVGSKFYPAGQTHVLPLLFSCLPGIDSNDMRKSMLTFQFISTFATLVPFVDCSSAGEHYPGLTEEQLAVCRDTAGFEDFVLEFLDRCFGIVESSMVEHTRSETAAEDASVSVEDNMKDVGMAATFSAVLTQCSRPIYEAALRKTKSFVEGRILEAKVAGKIAASLCRCLVKARPEEGLAALMPTVCR